MHLSELFVCSYLKVHQIKANGVIRCNGNEHDDGEVASELS